MRQSTSLNSNEGPQVNEKKITQVANNISSPTINNEKPPLSANDKCVEKYLAKMMEDKM